MIGCSEPYSIECVGADENVEKPCAEATLTRGGLSQVGYMGCPQYATGSDQDGRFHPAPSRIHKPQCPVSGGSLKTGRAAHLASWRTVWFPRCLYGSQSDTQE